MFFVGIYLYCNETKKYRNFLNQLLAWLPVFVVFVFFPSFQYGVGTDYETYYNYFYNNGHNLHYYRGEYLYYYLVEVVKYLGEPQLQFFIVSFIQGFLFFYLLFILKKQGYKSWIIWFLFICCTGLYHNQMNILRQSICIYMVLISVVIFNSNIFGVRKKTILISLNFLIPIFLHLSSVFASLILIISKLTFIKNKKYVFLLFLISIPIYSINFSSFIPNILDFFNLRYISYVDSEFSEGRSLLSVLTKIYYVPLIFYFWYLYLKDNKDDYLSSKNFLFIIYIFSVSYFLFLQAMDFGLVARIWQYFNFLIVFPLYFVIVRSNSFYRLLVFLYLIIPYLAKILFFPSAEYEYILFRGWF